MLLLIYNCLSLLQDPAACIAHTARQLIRVYPGPLRVDSSNFNPAPMWAAGVQVRNH